MPETDVGPLAGALWAGITVVGDGPVSIVSVVSWYSSKISGLELGERDKSHLTLAHHESVTNRSG